jgi:hypothetical protein
MLWYVPGMTPASLAARKSRRLEAEYSNRVVHGLIAGISHSPNKSRIVAFNGPLSAET